MGTTEVNVVATNINEPNGTVTEQVSTLHQTRPTLKPKSPKEGIGRKSTIKSLASKWIQLRMHKGEATFINTRAVYSHSISRSHSTLLDSIR
jgi:hypothetical protein